MRTTKLVFLLRSVLEYLRTNKLALHLLMGVLLILVYPMQSLFSGNQNIYFLWALDHLLPNAFAADPLLNSPDPYPLFSWLIGLFPMQGLAIWTTIIYVSLNSVYTYSLFGIANIFGKIYENPNRLLSFSGLFLAIHSTAIWGTFIGLQNDFDLRWVWDSGIAEQGVLRGYLQPSVFGVFLLLSVFRASKKDYAAAILWIAPAAMIHANYLFLGAILTVVYLGLSQFNKRSILASAILLLLVAPYTYYTANHFLLLDESMKSAINNAVIAGYDSNIHLNPSNWLQPKFYFQTGLLLIGVLLIWKTSLKPLFLTILSLTIGLTAMAYVTDSTTLISLNPWRLSVLLIPISSVVLLAKFIGSSRWKKEESIITLSIGMICAATVCFRVFGDGSTEFMQAWNTAFFIGLIIAAFIGWFFSKRLPTPVKSAFKIAMVFALMVAGLTEFHIENKTKKFQAQFAAISALAENTEPNTVYIIPPSWTSFRMNASKSVFVDENLVYGKALPDLMTRLKAINQAFSSNDFKAVLSSIPSGTSVKLITNSNSPITTAISEESLTENYSCYLLRE